MLPFLSLFSSNNSSNADSNENSITSGLQTAIQMSEGRVVADTQKAYSLKIDAIKEYYQQHNLVFTLPLASREILSFFGWYITSNNNNGKAFSTVRGYKSALVWYYKQQNRIIDESLNLELENFLAGYKRKVSQLKLDGQMAVFEGKHHLNFDGYLLIANKLLLLDEINQMVFAWPFFVLQWNLIARSASVSTIMLEHITWESDSMIITTPKHKGDQEGAKCYPKHIYANPLNPAICPILATALIIFCRSSRQDHNNQSSSPVKNFRLFEGTNQEARFSSILAKVLNGLTDDEEHRLGAKKKEIGTHSARKGAASYCCGMVGGPSAIQVYLRAGWSLGNVQDRYLFSGNGGDQITGRVVSGLPYNDVSFAALPPHFEHLNVNWETILPDYKHYPSTFKQAIPYLLASIVYHSDWLTTTLNSKHHLFSSYLYSSGMINVLKDRVLTGSSYCNRTKMVSTGIPPHLTTANELNLIRTTIEENNEKLPTILTNTMMSKFSINGAIPITMSDLNTMIDKIMQEIKSNNKNNNTNSVDSNTNSSSNFITWSWGGRFHMVPEGFTLPNNNIRDIFNLWYFGNMNLKIQPYRFLKSIDLINNAQCILLSRINKVMNELESIVKDIAADDIRISDITDRERVNVLFEQSFHVLMERINRADSNHRIGDLSVARVYDLILRVRKRRRASDADADADAD